MRSETEYFFVGHPLGRDREFANPGSRRYRGIGLQADARAASAIHIAWSDGRKWEINREFVAEVRKLADNHRPIVLICRSGNRSLDAGRALEAAGYTDVCNVLHGFEGELEREQHRGTRSGWRFEGLPWEQS